MSAFTFDLLTQILLDAIDDRCDAASVEGRGSGILAEALNRLDELGIFSRTSGVPIPYVFFLMHTLLV
jgi:hypothetical protein